MEEMDDERSIKRRKIDADTAISANEQSSKTRPGLGRPISPPLSRRKSLSAKSMAVAEDLDADDVTTEDEDVADSEPTIQQGSTQEETEDAETQYIPSSIQLTRINDLALNQNVDAVGLRDILEDPMIKECWNFNYLFDVDFVMKHFDEDVRNLVQVKLIHGFWKKDDERRIAMLEQCERYENVELLNAYIPDPFGTHHTKMLILFRHDDLAQVVIHTANMISRDWYNMTQAVWRSSLLPLSPSVADADLDGSQSLKIGSGTRFKIDLLRYLMAYGKRLTNLTKQLMDYDFSTIRAAFIGSTPSRQKPDEVHAASQTSFGWLGLQEILTSIPISSARDETTPPHIVMQVSSIATLGAAPTWLNNFQSVLSKYNNDDPKKAPTSASTASNSFFAKKSSQSLNSKKCLTPKFNIIFPAPSEIRTSLDGYAAGGSIHMKIQSAQQQKQLEYLLPLLCHWKQLPSEPFPTPSPTLASSQPSRRHALRGSAAPHIKTYIRFSDTAQKTIDWAMVTSANLSKQAWGDVVSKKDEIWIQSWEAGVVVWPALFTDEKRDGRECVMVPVFGRDMPNGEDVEVYENKKADEGRIRGRFKKVVGFRMPYDLPLSPYEKDEMPWCATARYTEPDWKGLGWGGY